MALYHWIDPQSSGQANADYFSKQVDLFDTPMIVGDNEQWWEWKSWSDCYEKKLIPSSQIVKLPPQKIFDVTAKFFDVLKTRYQGKVIAEYTAQWFLDGFQKGYDTWSVAKDLRKWLAAYINQKELIYTWDQFKTKIDTLGSPMLPIGWSEWDMWQISSTIFLPGMPRIDVNIVNPLSSVNTMFDGAPIPPVVIPVVPPIVVPPVVPPKKYCVYLPAIACPIINDTTYKVVVTSSWLGVCKGPAPVNVVDYVPNSTSLDILEESNGWGRTDKGWVNLKYTKRVS